MMMHLDPKDLLSALLDIEPLPTSHAPKDARGLYGLVDHFGELRYIGSTSSGDQSLYERIHQRHRTGSEGMSHYFSQMYNTGRMWRDRTDPATKADGNLAKKLRNEFVLDHCRAVWIALPDGADIPKLEAAVLSIAPERVIAWNRRRMKVYDEPTDLVDATLNRLCWGPYELAAIERQRLRFLRTSGTVTGLVSQAPIAPSPSRVAAFPQGPFRFFALDVETANHNRASICQIGVACVRPDNTIETWTTYVNPMTDSWVFTYLHGISEQTVRGAPTFAEVLSMLRRALVGRTVYQHSGFDRSAITAACKLARLPTPPWNWRDSVSVAREAWPELRGNGGHGLANLKNHLGLVFEHHDAGEDARAAAEVVLRAEKLSSAKVPEADRLKRAVAVTASDVCLTVDPVPAVFPVLAVDTEQKAASFNGRGHAGRVIGTTEITQGNIDHNHIYLRSFFEKFPADAIGGSSRALAAARQVTVDCGDGTVITTDLDGQKRFFRKRNRFRGFFERNGATPGDGITVEEIGPYSYRVVLTKRIGQRGTDT